MVDEAVGVELLADSWFAAATPTSCECRSAGTLSDIDVSVQGQGSNGACRAVVTTAQGLDIAIEIGFMWRLNESAAHPGERARLQVVGSRVAS